MDSAEAQREKVKAKEQQMRIKNMEASTTYLIKYVMKSIAKEEKLNMCVTGKRQMLSSKEQIRLLAKFLDLRANPQKNRVFQQIKTMIEENKQKKLAIRSAAERHKSLTDNRSSIEDYDSVKRSSKANPPLSTSPQPHGPNRITSVQVAQNLTAQPTLRICKVSSTTEVERQSADG